MFTETHTEAKIMRVILFGPPGVGKGTTARKLAEKYKLPHISTGDMLRAEIAKNSPLGKEAQQYVESGDLVPDELVTRIVKARLASIDATKGYFLDGYPRTVEQAKALKTFSDVDYVLNLSAPKKTVIDRIKHRGEGRRDDNPEIILRRMEEYENNTKPLIDFYRNEGVLVDIDSTQDIEGVAQQCIEALDEGN